MNPSEAESFSMRTRLSQMEEDLKILAAEVRAWRRAEWDNRELMALGNAIAATNESNVLARISE